KTRPAGRVHIKRMEQDADAILAARFGTPKLIEKFQPPWFHFNPAVLAKSGHSRDEVGRALADYLAPRPDVARAFTAADLLAASPADEVATRMRRSYHPARCGDVCPVLK